MFSTLLKYDPRNLVLESSKYKMKITFCEQFLVKRIRTVERAAEGPFAPGPQVLRGVLK